MSPFRRVSAVFVIVCVAVPTIVFGQSMEGPFQNFDPWWLGPGSTLGVSFDGQLHIDRDGNGSTEATYSLPGALTGSENFRLTPTREVLYVFGGNCGTGGVNVWFYSVPAPPGALMLIDTACIGNSINQQGFYDTGIAADPVGQIVPTTPPFLYLSPLRIAYVSWTDPNDSAILRIMWFDLVAGNHGQSQPFNASLAYPLKVSPSGAQAFVQHDLPIPGEGDYRLIDLCPGSTGADLSSLSNQPDALSASIRDVSGGNLTVRVTRPDNTVLTDIPLVDCLASSPPPTGACCQPCGVCSITTPSACAAITGAFWIGAGTACTSCPLFPALSVTKSGPAGPIEQGVPFTYTLNYQNTGGAAATGVTVTDTLPANTTFVSANSGGSLSAGVVTWTIGTLGPCTSGSVTLTVRGNCNVSSVTNSSYSIRRPGIITPGSPSVTTTLTPPSTAGVSVSINSVPARVPLRGGDIVTHTVTLTNSAAETRPTISFSFQPGGASTFGTVLNAGGGAFSGSSPITWTGALAPNAVVDIVFTTIIDTCIGPTTNSTHLNNGSLVSVLNGCATVVGSATAPGPFDLARPVRVSLVATNLSPAQPTNPAGTLRYQVARPGAPIDFLATISNLFSDPQPSTSISLVLPAGLIPDGNQPVTVPASPAATYDAGTRTIAWSGPLAATQTVTVAFHANLDPAAACQTTLSLGGGYGVCSNLVSNLRILAVPQPPSGPHLIGLDPFGGLWTLEPGSSSAPQTLLCFTPEIFHGLGRGPNGDIWLAGLPVIKLNPYTLDFQILDSAFINTMDMTTVRDVAVDPVDGSAILVGQRQIGPQTYGRMRRYQPANGQLTTILDDTTPTGTLNDIWRVSVDHENQIVAAARFDRIIRVDPANPAAYQTFMNAGFFPGTLRIDDDGDYLTTDYTFGTATARRMMKVNRLTGAFSTVVADLNSVIPSSNPFIGAALGSNGDVYLSPEPFGVWVVHRLPGVSGTLVTGTRAVDLEFVPGAVAGRGDMNCDGAIDGRDVQAFTDAVLDVAVYGLRYAGCNILNGDFNTDGSTTAGDTNGFVQCVLTGTCP